MIEAVKPSLLAFATEAVQVWWRRNVLGITIAVLWSLLAPPIIYYGWLQSPWLSYSHMPWQPKQQAYVAGEAAVIKVWRCNSSPDPDGEDYLLSHALIKLDPPYTEQCPRRTVLPGGLVHIEKGQCGVPEDSAANVPPVTTCPGRYKLTGVATVGLTWRTVKVPWESEEFLIKAKEAP